MTNATNKETSVDRSQSVNHQNESNEQPCAFPNPACHWLGIGGEPELYPDDDLSEDGGFGHCERCGELLSRKVVEGKEW